MPIFDVDIHGTKYQIDAPDENQAATQALRLSQQGQPVGLDVERQKAIAMAQATALAEQQSRKVQNGGMTLEQQRAEAEADAARRAAGEPQLITMPDGQVVSFPGDMPDVQIRGLIASKYPKEVAQATLAKPASERDVSGHYEFNGSNIPGYDLKTGIVSGGAIDDNLADQYGIGIRRTAEASAGLPGDIGPMFGGLGGALANQLGVDPEAQGNLTDIITKMASAAFNPVGAVLPYDNAISTDQIRDKITNPLFGDPGKPLTDKGQAARTFGEFASGAFIPGGIPRKVLMMLAPAAASEGAGYATKDTPYEPYARTAAALLAGGVTAAVRGGNPAAKAASDLGARTKDLTRIIKRAQQDGLSPEQIRERLAALGPEATLMDVGPNLRQEGQRIYAAGGRGRGIIDESLTARDAGANQRIRGELDANLGPAFAPSKIDAGLKRTQRSLGPEYDRVLAEGRAVNTEAIANDIQSALANTRGDARTALEKVRDMLRIEGSSALDPHPRAALATRQAIDGMMGSITDGNVRHHLGEVRKSLDAELGKAVPGLKAVDAKHANLAEQRKAVERGQTVLDSGRDSPWPADLAADIAKGGRVGKFRLAQGARADIERIIGTNANDRARLAKLVGGEGDWNRQKLGQLFGQDKADRIISVLEREGTFAETSNRVMKNSATAERQADGVQSFGMREAAMAGGPKAIAYSGIVKSVDAVLNKLRGAAAASRDERVARILADTSASRVSTALLKANGGKPLQQNQIEGAVRTLLLTSGATAGNR